MQLARGNEFLKILRPLVTAQFGEQPALEEANFIRLNQRVKPGLIRVDADEVSYPATSSCATKLKSADRRRYRSGRHSGAVE